GAVPPGPGGRGPGGGRPGGRPDPRTCASGRARLRPGPFLVGQAAPGGPADAGPADRRRGPPAAGARRRVGGPGVCPRVTRPTLPEPGAAGRGGGPPGQGGGDPAVVPDGARPAARAAPEPGPGATGGGTGGAVLPGPGQGGPQEPPGPPGL